MPFSRALEILRSGVRNERRRRMPMSGGEHAPCAEKVQTQ